MGAWDNSPITITFTKGWIVGILLTIGLFITGLFITDNKTPTQNQPTVIDNSLRDSINLLNNKLNNVNIELDNTRTELNNRENKIAKKNEEINSIMVENKDLNKSLKNITRRNNQLENELRAEKNNHYSLKIENEYNKVIYICAHYKNLMGNWVTEGWWNIKANSDTIISSIKTWNDTLYLHIEDEIGQILYLDSTHNIKRNITANKSNFYSLNDDDLSYSDSLKESSFK